VLGTLVLQGQTLKSPIRRMGLTGDEPVGREIRLARTHAYFALTSAKVRSWPGAARGPWPLTTQAV
jgi:hypothetical protein